MVQIKKLYRRFYADVSEEQCQAFYTGLRVSGTVLSHMLPHNMTQALCCPCHSQVALPSVSMAQLQGHLLRYKSDPVGAQRDVHLLATEKRVSGTNQGGRGNSTGTGGSAGTSTKTAPPASKRRVLSVEEVDKMVFNPQEGWDKGIPSI